MPGSLFSDRITLVKKDGSIAKKDIHASVQREKIYTQDVKLIVERDDHILRTLPNGMVEDYIVGNAHFQSGGSLSHWEIHVRRSDAPLAAPQTIINNITGHNARVNVNSTDNSNNAVSINSEKLFADLAAALRDGIKDQSQRDRLLLAVEDLQSAQQGGTFKESYQKFIASAAEHITVIGPFLPALSAML